MLIKPNSSLLQPNFSRFSNSDFGYLSRYGPIDLFKEPYLKGEYSVDIDDQVVSDVQRICDQYELKNCTELIWVCGHFLMRREAMPEVFKDELKTNREYLRDLSQIKDYFESKGEFTLHLSGIGLTIKNQLILRTMIRSVLKDKPYLDKNYVSHVLKKKNLPKTDRMYLSAVIRALVAFLNDNENLKSLNQTYFLVGLLIGTRGWIIRDSVGDSMNNLESPKRSELIQRIKSIHNSYLDDEF